MRYLQEAFDQVCADAKPASGWFVSLMENSQRYGGPEEGGWWSTDTHVVAYQYFATEEEAQAAKVEVEKLAKQLARDAQRAHGEQCLREMDWCEARGLDADYLPEPDGPSNYYVLVSEGIPSETRGPTHYE